MYHVTPKSNLANIRKHGLIPKIGPRSRQINEPIPAVYLFPTKDDYEEALDNWLGDEFKDSEVAILPIKLTEKDVLHNDGSAPYERAVIWDIEPNLIDWEHVTYQ